MQLQKVLTFSVIVPYLKRKGDRLFEKLREDEADGIYYDEKALNRSREYFLLIYPYIHLLHSSSAWLFMLMYSIKRSRHHHLWTYLEGVTLVFRDPNRSRDDNQKEGGDNSLPARLAGALATGLTFSLETGAFFLQFLDWW